MKDKLKVIYFWIIRLGQTIVSLLLVLCFNRIGTARNVRKQKGVRDGQAVSLIANGPSAREIVNNRRDLLEGTDLMVLNNFGNQEIFFQLKPRYYIIIDPAYFDFNFSNPGLEEKGTGNDRSEERKLMENFKRVDWKITLFIPDTSAGRNAVKLYADNTNIEVVLFNATRVLGFDSFQNRMYGRGSGIPSSRNVIIPAMALMIILGYKKMYLYGCELSWTKTMDVDPENGKMFFNDHHFYSKSEIRYFGKGAYLWWLKVITEDLEGVEQVAKFAKKRGVSIVNRTKGSFIDCFDYENPDRL